jgi:hypothetical protein
VDGLGPAADAGRDVFCLVVLGLIVKHIKEFAEVFKLYRKGGHGIRYSLATAWRIAVRGADF